ncbi:unnamed protein product [Brassica napus]|uniref:(rape) hypothetical protein n=1 Tax=Brassica napus TaxID=3708 RepID=A0A816YBC9_BRANA|nr:unnamed protein product [Brassica napus]
MAKESWTDEECRYFFTLYADEKKKGNKTRLGMSLTRRDFIINKFEERFGKRHIWDRFKNKIDISRKAYIKVKKLTHNRTGLVYDAMGRLQMPDAWWDDRIKEWPGARKYKKKTIPNMDMFEAEFGGVTVTGAEGWSAQQGEASLDFRVDAEKDEDESDSVDIDMPAPREGTSRAGCSRSKRKRKEVVQESSYDVRNAILADKNKIAEKMLQVLESDHLVVERNHKCRVDYVVEVLN